MSIWKGGTKQDYMITDVAYTLIYCKSQSEAKWEDFDIQRMWNSLEQMNANFIPIYTIIYTVFSTI